MAQKPPSERFFPSRTKQGFGGDSDGGGVSDRKEERQGTNPSDKSDDLVGGRGWKKNLGSRKENKAVDTPKKTRKALKGGEPLSAKIDIEGLPELKPKTNESSFKTQWGDWFTKDANLATEGKAALLKSIGDK